MKTVFRPEMPKTPLKILSKLERERSARLRTPSATNGRKARNTPRTPFKLESRRLARLETP